MKLDQLLQQFNEKGLPVKQQTKGTNKKTKPLDSGTLIKIKGGMGDPPPLTPFMIGN